MSMCIQLTQYSYRVYAHAYTSLSADSSAHRQKPYELIGILIIFVKKPYEFIGILIIFVKNPINSLILIIIFKNPMT